MQDNNFHDTISPMDKDFFQNTYLESGPAADFIRSAMDMRSAFGRTTILPKIQAEEAQSGPAQLVIAQQSRYQEKKALGEGGAGEVVLVKDQDIQRYVALKRIKSEENQALHLMRFVKEIQITGQLSHPNIIPIYDIGIDEAGQYYYTMKFVQGETLEDIITKLRAGDKEYHEKYSFERRTQIFIEILQAIRFAHERGIIHRDIKPANIMLGPYGEVMVMDWGIAKRIRETSSELETNYDENIPQEIRDAIESQKGKQFETQHGVILGTPAYMSPEQILAPDKIDERSDLYSLTALYYEFTTLRHYMEHKRSFEELMHGVIMEKPVDPEKLKNKFQTPVPREICFFVRKGLQKKPKERFQSAVEMLEELQANAEGKTCVYCPSTFLKRGSHEYGRYLDRHRVLGVVLFCLFVIFFGIGLVQSFILLKGYLI